MTERGFKRLLVATDLSEASDAVVRAAGSLAAQTQAELHVVHAVERGAMGFPIAAETRQTQREEARELLDRQLDRSLPAGVETASRLVAAGPVIETLENRAEEVGADLLVLGPHGGTDLGAALLGSNADRLLRTSRRPCLVVRHDLHVPVRRLGVPVDFSDFSRGALHLAFRWMPALTAGRTVDDPTVRVVHVGWPVTKQDFPDHERETLLPQLASEIEGAAKDPASPEDGSAEVLWHNRPPEAICQWAADREIDLLVLGTHGRSGLTRALIGSLASRLAREAPCSVLLVPPSEERGAWKAAPALDRFLVGTDFSRCSREAATWVAEHLLPQAEMVLVHSVDVPYCTSLPSQGMPSLEELTRTSVQAAERRLGELAAALPRPPVQRLVRTGRNAAVLVRASRDVGADLVVVGDQGRREGLWAQVGSTAENLLATSPVPVLLVRNATNRPPAHLLVPMDDSAEASNALTWAALLAQRLEARITLLHVVSSGLTGAIRRVSSAPVARELGERVRTDLGAWLDGLVAERGLPAERTETLVEVGVPGLQILAAAARLDCDLVVMGSRGSGGARLLGLGGVASTVVRHGATSVLVVPPPNRS